MDINQAILGHVEEAGECTYAELTDQLGVSTMTVRRRVAELVTAGVVIKTPGGVRSAAGVSPLYESAIQSRLRKNRPQKRAIAAAAASLIAGTETLFIDGSTTCLELARKLVDHAGLTVVTNSALMCLELGCASKCRVIAVGGQYDPMSLSYGGPTAEDIARRFFPDIAFFSTKGFIADEGTFESSEPMFRMKQIVAEQCRKVVLLADHTKFGERGLCKVLNTVQIHHVITDAAAPKQEIDRLRTRGIEVTVA